jgi:hypothetical protein
LLAVGGDSGDSDGGARGRGLGPAAIGAVIPVAAIHVECAVGVGVALGGRVGGWRWASVLWLLGESPRACLAREWLELQQPVVPLANPKPEKVRFRVEIGRFGLARQVEIPP